MTDQPTEDASWLDLDLDAEGLQHGFLSVANANPDAEWGTFRVPLTLMQRGEGPTVSVIAGHSNDACVGPLAIHRLIRELELSRLRGRLILLPALNPFGVTNQITQHSDGLGEDPDAAQTLQPVSGPDDIADTATDSVAAVVAMEVTEVGSDADPSAVPTAGPDVRPDATSNAGSDSGSDARPDSGSDAGRDAVTQSVPDTIEYTFTEAAAEAVTSSGDDGSAGSKAGETVMRESQQSRLRAEQKPDDSHAMSQVILRQLLLKSDVVIDLRSGSRDLCYSPTATVRFRRNGDLQVREEALMIAFGAPDSTRLVSRQDQHGFENALAAADIPYLVAQLGGGGTANVDQVHIALTGVRNVLVQLEMLNEPLSLCSTRMLEVRSHRDVVVAPAAGLLEVTAVLGRDVYRGNPIANIVDPHRTGSAPVPLLAPRDGVLLARRHSAWVQPGDCVAIVADEVQR